MTDNLTLKAFTPDMLQGLDAEVLRHQFADAYNPFVLHNYSDGDRAALMAEYKRRGMEWPGPKWTVIHWDSGVIVTDEVFVSQWAAEGWLEENLPTLDPPKRSAYEIDEINPEE